MSRFAIVRRGRVSQAPPSDTTPDAFSFGAPVTNATRSTVYQSPAITVTGINAPASISVSGGEYQINGGSWTSAAGAVANGANVKVRLTSSASYSTLARATLTIGGVSADFDVTTGAASAPADYTVSNLTDLNNALAAIGPAGGKIIDLNPGAYGQWSPAQRVYASEVVLRAKDPANPPVMNIYSMSGGVEGLAFEGVKFNNPGFVNGFDAQVRVSGIKRWRFTGCKFRGTRSDGGKARALWLIGFDTVTVEYCDIQDTSDTCIADPYNRTTPSLNLVFQYNSMKGSGSDTITFRGIWGLTIRGNYATRFNPQPGDHPDALQIFQNDNPSGGVSYPDTVGCKDVLIKDNFFRFTYAATSSTFGRGQGIFVSTGNSTNPVFHERVTIEDNTVIAPMANGIFAVKTLDGTLTIQRNRVFDIAWGDSHNVPQIYIGGCTNVTMRDNQAPLLSPAGDVTFAVNTGNTATGAAGTITEGQADAEEAAWKAAFPAVPVDAAL